MCVRVLYNKQGLPDRSLSGPLYGVYGSMAMSPPTNEINNSLTDVFALVRNGPLYNL